MGDIVRARAVDVDGFDLVAATVTATTAARRAS
jgi:hypothetical protein